MDYTLHREWFEYLLKTRTIPFEVYADMVVLFENRRQAVHTQGLIFSRRMAEENPDVWTAFCAKKRIGV